MGEYKHKIMWEFHKESSEKPHYEKPRDVLLERMFQMSRRVIQPRVSQEMYSSRHSSFMNMI